MYLRQRGYLTYTENTFCNKNINLLTLQYTISITTINQEQRFDLMSHYFDKRNSSTTTVSMRISSKSS